MSNYDQLQTSIQDLRNELVSHRLYEQLTDLESMHLFMETHVFAVWDFMSLLKSLQRELTCIRVPWRPTGNARTCRFVNQIVLAEESDIGVDSGPASHVEIYLSAMNESGADLTNIQALIDSLDGRSRWQKTIQEIPMPEAARNFVDCTFSIMDSRDTCQIASAFTFGREDLLPNVFEKIVARISSDSPGRLQTFEYYLQRHIELDGEEHGAIARCLMEDLCGDNGNRWRAAADAAFRSLYARKQMWDAIADQIEARVP